MDADFQAHEAEQEPQDAPEPLNAGIIDVTVNYHNGPDGVGCHQHSGVPSRRNALQLEKEDAHVVDESFEDAENQGTEGEPQVIREEQRQREQDRNINRLSDMCHAGRKRTVINLQEPSRHKVQELALVTFFVFMDNQPGVHTKREFLHQLQVLPVANTPQDPSQEDERHDMDVVLKKPESKLFHKPYDFAFHYYCKDKPID